jgi:PAS domain-containing protein
MIHTARENPVEKVFRESVIIGLVNHTVLLARAGTERPTDDSGAPIRGEDGEIIGAVLAFRDVAERRRASER